MGHAYPCEEEAFIENDGFLEIFSGDLIFFAVEVVGTYCEPTDGM